MTATQPSSAAASASASGANHAGSVPAELEREATQFLFHEARLLDEQRFEEWLALFAPDGFYWIPTSADQTDPLHQISIVYEDASVLRLRVARLRHPRAYAATPFPRTAHLVSNVMVSVDGGQAGDIHVRSTFMAAEYRDGDRAVRAGLAAHRLRRTSAGLRIVLKRVDLIDAASPPGLIQVPL